MSAMITTQTI